MHDIEFDSNVALELRPLKHGCALGATHGVGKDAVQRMWKARKMRPWSAICTVAWVTP